MTITNYDLTFKNKAEVEMFKYYKNINNFTKKYVIILTI